MKNMYAIRDRLQQVFAELTLFIESRRMGVVARTGFSANDVFALRAYLSFALQPGEEVVVLSVDCKRHNEDLILRSDIATASGEIIAEGPTFQLGQLDSGEFISRSSMWADEFTRFIADNQERVLSYLVGEKHR